MEILLHLYTYTIPHIRKNSNYRNITILLQILKIHKNGRINDVFEDKIIIEKSKKECANWILYLYYL